VAALILVKPGLDWQSTGGLFDFTLEFLIPKLSDKDTADWLQTVVDNNLGSVWLTDFPADTQQQIFDLLRSGLVPAAERELPDTPAKATALAQLRELVDLTYREPGSGAS
jgi:hypothetical protein